VNVTVELPPAATEAGTNPALAPAGRPEADNAIASALPETTAVLTAVEPEPPAVIETVEGVVPIEKSLSAGTVTVSVTVVVWVAEGAVPVTVIG
jgi:hypothetical protein